MRMSFQPVYGVLISKQELLSCLPQVNQSTNEIKQSIIPILQNLFNHYDSSCDPVINKYCPGLSNLIKNWELRMLLAPRYICPNDQEYYVFGLFSEKISVQICPTQEMKQAAVIFRAYFNINREFKCFAFK